MSQQTLTICARCKGDACLATPASDAVTTYLCFGCGFHTSTLMKDGEEFHAESIQSLPELHKDLAFVDAEGLCWTPYTVNVEDKGLVFCNGTDAKDWKWTAAKAVVRTEEDKILHPKNQSVYKMDMQNAQHYAEKSFMDALEFVGVFQQD